MSARVFPFRVVLGRATAPRPPAPATVHPSVAKLTFLLANHPFAAEVVEALMDRILQEAQATRQ